MGSDINQCQTNTELVGLPGAIIEPSVVLLAAVLYTGPYVLAAGRVGS